jgi:hypothetical protein
MVRMLQHFLETSKDVLGHMFEYNDAIHNFLETYVLKQTIQKKITDYFKG